MNIICVDIEKSINSNWGNTMCPHNVNLGRLVTLCEKTNSKVVVMSDNCKHLKYNKKKFSYKISKKAVIDFYNSEDGFLTNIILENYKYFLNGITGGIKDKKETKNSCIQRLIKDGNKVVVIQVGINDIFVNTVPPDKKFFKYYNIDTFIGNITCNNILKFFKGE